MRSHYTRRLFASWSLGALATMALIGALAIASMEEERTRVAEAIEQSASHAQQRSKQLRDRGARAICHEHHASAVPRWEEDGALTCVVIAQGAQR